MPNDKNKLTRVTFGKGTGAEQVADAIREMQDAWAKKYPKRAYELYPDVYDEEGNRIRKDDDEE